MNGLVDWHGCGLMMRAFSPWGVPCDPRALPQAGMVTSLWRVVSPFIHQSINPFSDGFVPLLLCWGLFVHNFLRFMIDHNR
jgi:hypothetical protein